METVRAFPDRYNKNGNSLYLPRDLRCAAFIPDNLVPENSGSRKTTLEKSTRTFPDSGTTVYLLYRRKHTLFAWAEALEEEKIEKGATLIHFDNQLDGLKPSRKLASEAKLSDIASYVRSSRSDQYIHPAIDSGIIGYVHWFADHRSRQPATFPLNQLQKSQIGLTEKMDKQPKKNIILDIDMAYFNHPFWYFSGPNDYEYYLLRNLIQKAGVVTISLNPGSVQVKQALQTVNNLIAVNNLTGNSRIKDLKGDPYIETLANSEAFHRKVWSKSIIKALNTPPVMVIRYAPIPKGLENAVAF